ncbi:MAG TPA: HlyD family efflux transporter periplasmic adaptor subunit [Clostridia bacterium]|nr:HlyD family efflux transporter periplasmic adaptor subunit [Clostridia bacterium]
MKVKKKLGLLLGIILLISIISITTIIAAVPSKHRKIVISTAHKKNLVQTVTVEGVVEPNKKQIINLDSNQKVLEVFAAVGQEIKKGDLVLKLDSSDNQYKLSVEEINLKLAERELSKVLKNGKTDKKDVEYSFKQAEIAYADGSAGLESAQNSLAADKLLFENGAISRSQYVESQKNVRDQENRMTLKAMEMNRASQSLANFDLDKDEQVFKLGSNISLIQQNISNLKSKVDADTRANIDGKIVKLEVETDQYPTDDNSQILIYDMSKQMVNIQLKQQEALYIKEGMKAGIKVKGLDEKEYAGTVVDVDDVALTSISGGNGSKVNVKISIDNPDERIKIGYDVEVKINLYIKDEAVVVDFESIVQDNDGKKYIYFVKDNVAQRRPVGTGIETSFEVEITEGIIQGDRYVVNPPEEMQEKSSMKIWGWRYESK